MSNYWLGLDCGGSWLKAGLYDGAGREVAVQRLPLHALSPQPGWVERDMTELWQQCGSVISKLLAHTGVSVSQIRGLGISAQGKGLFLLDKSDRPLGKAILSSDRRAMEIVQRWQKEAVPQKLYPLTRQTLWTGHPVSLLRWVKENEPQRYAQIGCVMMTHDYLRWCLTGVKGCEESNISESNLYNMATGQYDPRLTEWLGISEIDSALPPVVGSAEICGEITAQAAAITGLAVGTPVVGGLFDVVSTALCAGIEDESTLNAVMGTWAVTSGIAHGLRDHEAHPYVYGRYVNDGQYIVHEASPTSSGNLSAWGNDVTAELKLGIDRIAAIHLKDTLPVTGDSPGQFRDVPFGEGCVDFVGIFKTLHELNYRGSFLIEMWTEKASEPVLEIIQARRWIESRMQEGGFTC